MEQTLSAENKPGNAHEGGVIVEVWDIAVWGISTLVLLHPRHQHRNRTDVLSGM